MKMPLHSIFKHPLKSALLFMVLALLLTQCSKSSSPSADPGVPVADDPPPQDDSPASNPSPNLLFVLADDLGIDAMPGYALGMPTLELANNGLRFTYFNLFLEQNNNMDPNERILQRAFNEQTNGAYRTSIIGKWHVSAGNDFDLPEAMGVDHYAGLFGGGVDDYSEWRLTANGSTTVQNSYITTALTDMALEWITAQEQP